MKANIWYAVQDRDNIFKFFSDSRFKSISVVVRKAKNHKMEDK